MNGASLFAVTHSFNLAQAIEAVRCNRLQEWLDSFLTVHNVALRDGLKRQPRYWFGPALFPLEALLRCCGPEENMEFPMALAAWERRVARIQVAASGLEAFPPCIAMYQQGTLTLRDGNTRHEAFRRMGFSHCWSLLWFNSAEDVVEAGMKLQECVRLPALKC